jgi:hypothetical protein
MRYPFGERSSSPLLAKLFQVSYADTPRMRHSERAAWLQGKSDLKSRGPPRSGKSLMSRSNAATARVITGNAGRTESGAIAIHSKWWPVMVMRSRQGSPYITPTVDVRGQLKSQPPEGRCDSSSFRDKSLIQRSIFFRVWGDRIGDRSSTRKITVMA